MWLVIFIAAIILFIWHMVFPVFGILIRHLLLIYNLYSTDLPKLGQWAVVTGSTDGIGLAYARKFVNYGCNVLLISRSTEKLETVAAELRKLCQSNQKVDFIRADLSQKDDVISVAAQLAKLDVGILVNNVGMTQPYPAVFHEAPVPDNFFIKMIYCNVFSTVHFTRAVLKGMIARNKGLLITIGSASSIFPVPMSAIYSSTKHFLDIFTESIRQEISDTNIQVHMVMPFYVRTKFIGKFNPPSWLAPNAEDYVEHTMQMINIEPRTHGTLSHALQGFIMRMVPLKISTYLAYKAQSKRQKVLLDNMQKK